MSVISEEVFEKWLYACEGESIDFKRDQYKFVNAENHEKAELLKDILAMANSWCDSDAYIVIGIEERSEKPNILHGITDHIDDAWLQEFVSYKTNQICKFEYLTHTTRGLTLGIIKVPRQLRPVYLKRDFGFLKANEVHVKRGSSTAIASLEEIAIMRIEAKDNRRPNLRLAFYDEQTGASLEDSIEQTTSELVVTDGIPDYGITGGMSGWEAVADITANRDYFREAIQYVNFYQAYLPLTFTLENTGDIEAVNIRIEIEFPTTVTDLRTNEVNKPEANKMLGSGHVISHLPWESAFSIYSHEDKWVVETNLERLHAKRKVCLDDRLYLRVGKSVCEKSLLSRIAVGLR